MSEPYPSLGFIGSGRVAGTLARLLHAQGVKIAAVWNRTPDRAAALADSVGAEVFAAPGDVLAACDIAFITTADDAIGEMAHTLAGTGKPGRAAVVHTSGARGADVLGPLAALGVSVGAFHPAYPFASDAMPTLAGATFALESQDPSLMRQLRMLVGCLGGQTLVLQPADRPRYHAALVMTSNYTVALYAAGQRLLASLGADPAAADSALLALLDATAANIRARGIPGALTGPLLRADLGTVAAHLDALAPDPDLHRAYLALAQLTLPLVEASGVDITPIQALLHQKETP